MFTTRIVSFQHHPVLISLLSAVLLAACGGGSGSPAPTYSIGGTVSGVYLGQSIVLKNNGGDDLVVDSSGNFTFRTAMTSGTYSVTLDTTNSDKNCMIENGAGSISGANVTNVSVRCYGAFVLVSNAGAGSVSRYVIGADGQLSHLGDTTATSPQHVAIHGNGKYAYVGTASGTIEQFTLGSDGSLSPMTTASVAAGGAGSVKRVVVNGNYAYALNYTDGKVYQYTIGSDGALTPMTTASLTVGTNPSAMVVNGNCNCAIIGEDQAAGSLYVYDVSPSDGSLSFKMAYGFNFRTVDIAQYLARNQLWVAGGTANEIRSYSVTNLGVLAATGFSNTLNNVTGLAIHWNGALLWASGNGGNLVRPYQISASDAQLGAAGLDSTSSLPGAIASDGSHVYVLNPSDDTVSQFAVGNAATGQLTALTAVTVATGTTPSGIALY